MENANDGGGDLESPFGGFRSMKLNNIQLNFRGYTKDSFQRGVLEDADKQRDEYSEVRVTDE
jgi:hypothetical protein